MGAVDSTPSMSVLGFHGTEEAGAVVVGVVELDESFLGRETDIAVILLDF
jgi:hypothetical protein